MSPKYSQAIIAAAKALEAQGVPLAAIAARLGIAPGSIQYVLTQETPPLPLPAPPTPVLSEREIARQLALVFPWGEPVVLRVRR